MADIATAATEASPFVAELEAKNLHPLWDRYQRITPIKPQPPDAPFIWRWREVEPLLQRSVGEVSINDIERRALIMAHPAFGAETTTTSTLLAAFTVLDPGERARPHRHTGAAIRFATRAEGAVTIVDGRRCEMKAGDLILTPPMVWHGHINESDHRIIWFDAAVMPTLDCYAGRLDKGTMTRRKRATYNVVCLVIAGEGRSSIGEETFEWSQHDVFTIPHWTWARHEARGGDADLFMVTDKSAFERLDLVREEME